MMLTIWLALWLQMSAQPQIQGSCAKCLVGTMTQQAEKTDGRPPLTSGEPIRYCLDNEIINIEGKELATCDKGQWVTSDWMKRAAEPVDVPAVQEPTREPPDCSLEPFTGGTYDGWRTPSRWNDMCGSEKPMATTCADKSRILEHDENSPPKYWCRKVEF